MNNSKLQWVFNFTLDSEDGYFFYDMLKLTLDSLERDSAEWQQFNRIVNTVVDGLQAKSVADKSSLPLLN
jgi:hypothetical protein